MSGFKVGLGLRRRNRAAGAGGADSGASGGGCGGLGAMESVVEGGGTTRDTGPASLSHGDTRASAALLVANKFMAPAATGLGSGNGANTNAFKGINNITVPNVKLRKFRKYDTFIWHREPHKELLQAITNPDKPLNRLRSLNSM
ncbi:unnamed protein product [Meganyctiphanes norvegica]|uniref:Uncharacterized protein n=1 Tax=Meganyctiphanes norvegica TaxID=48144 RepID=A0AAV2SKR2_MEGNR